MTQDFYYQHIEWLWNEFDTYMDEAYRNLRKDLEKRDHDDAEETLVWATVTKMTAQANIELAHHRQKLKKYCGFGDCKYIPSCIKGLE